MGVGVKRIGTDDSLLSIRTLSSLLNDMGHLVIQTAPTGVLALKAYRETMPDLVTMDIILGLRRDPKFDRVYDAEIVGDSIAKSVPLGRDVIAQEAEESLAEAPVCRVALVVGDSLVHRAP